jgi:tRNA pseudouridine38-40 synthase
MIESKNIKIIIAYDGANYSGWQKQKNKKTIQGIIEEKIRIIAGDKSIKLHGSGRTDAGVHAIGQVANFKTSSDLPVDKWLPVLNNELPENIRIMSARQVAEKFHARYSAISKLYKYYVMTGNSVGKNYNYSLRYVFLKNYCYFLNKELDVDRMNKTAKYLVGYHDFTSLSCLNKKKSQRKENRTRKVISLNITKKKKLVCFSIEANAFLYKMVRIIVGTLIDFSVNEREPEEIIKLIEVKNNLKSGKVVPANGLYLMKVRYK